MKEHLLYGFYMLTRGRPMTKYGYALTDQVTGEPVYFFVDAFGRNWMACHSWSLFRVPVDRELNCLDRMVEDLVGIEV